MYMQYNHCHWATAHLQLNILLLLLLLLLLLHTLVAGTIQMIKLSLSYSFYIKVFFYTVEGVSI
jgi:hypothetical protein